MAARSRIIPQRPGGDGAAEAEGGDQMSADGITFRPDDLPNDVFGQIRSAGGTCLGTQQEMIGMSNGRPCNSAAAPSSKESGSRLTRIAAAKCVRAASGCTR